AGDQGREVLGVPGPITSPTSAGVNRLLRDGVGPYLEPDDLLRHYPGVSIVAERHAGGRLSLDDFPTLAGAGAELARVAGLLDGNGASVDLLAERAAMPPSDLMGHLSALEIAGF